MNVSDLLTQFFCFLRQDSCGSTPVPSSQDRRVCFGQSPALVVEDFQGQAGVELRVVDTAAFELAVLVVFDEVVVGVAGEGQGAELQGVNGRQPEQPQVGLGGLEVRQVEVDEVVAQQEVGAVSQPVESDQCRLETQAVAGKDQPLFGVGPYSRQGVDAGVLLANFEVER